MWPWAKLREAAAKKDCTDLVNELTTRRDELISVIAGKDAHIARLDARVKTLEAQLKLLRPRPRPRGNQHDSR
jgi:hypothetical protein